MEALPEFIPFDVESEESEIEQEKPFQSLSVLTPLPIPPWVPDNPNYSSDMLRLLNQEIDDYLQYMSPSQEEHQLRIWALERLEQVVSKTFPGSETKVFGSFATKLYLPSSDLDVVVLAQVDNKIGLRRLHKALEKADIMSRIELILGAKVPILKVVDSLTNFRIDISFNSQNGLETVEIVNKFLNDSVCGEGLRSLMLILKQFLSQRHLNEVYTGGISSYSLLLMIASFLKLHPKIQTREIVAHENLGVLLIEFFELYGLYFNYNRVGIAVDVKKGAWYFKKSHYFPPGDRLCIMDPQDRSNDVSRGSYNCRRVFSEFQRAYRSLIAMIGAGYENRKHIQKSNNLRPGSKKMITILGSILTLERSVLEHRDFVEHRYQDIIQKRVDKKTIEKECVPQVPKPIELQKRKRDIVYTVDSHSEPDEPPKKRKNQQKTPKKQKEIVVISSDESDLDITRFYGMNPNAANLRDTDGLDY